MLCLSFRNETKFIPRHLLCLFTSSQTFAASITVENISKLPIHSVENSNSKANMTAIIGGKGLKNKKEKSKNYLVKQREIFTNPELNCRKRSLSRQSK